MFGMEMMLKSMGLDPAEITESVQKFGAVFMEMKTQLDRIEHKLNAVLVSNLSSAETTINPNALMGKDNENGQ